MAKKIVLNRIFPALAVAAVLAGCAAGTGKPGVQPEDLRNSAYYITDLMFTDLDFPTLQRNLYQHRAACGSAPRFVMHEGETSLATLIETSEIPESYEQVVIADMVQYPESLRSAKKILVQAYSYYHSSDVQQRLDRMLDAVRRPGNCGAAAQ